ncbi:MAG: hypothetical protein LBH06_04795 [Rikenellaceae bacterium]|nr:hypothetical protein [Rikenellaceae bacterium]
MRVKKGENPFGFVFPQGDIQGIEKIETLLKIAGGKPDLCELSDFSKGGNGKAKSEYVITFNSDANIVLVVECKRSIGQHASEDLNKPKKYAVDGALYYAKFLKEGYNVVAVAVSGTKREDCKVSTFYWQKGIEDYRELTKINIILEPLNYLKFIKGEKISIAYSLEDIRRTAIEMNNNLRIAKVTANNKPIFIAGILIALQDEAFDAEYQTATTLGSLVERLQSAIARVLRSTNVEQGRIESILSAFNDVASLHHFQTTPMPNDNSLRWYI